MPKIRALHPDFWTDDAVVSVQPLARLLYQGLWNYACDNGHVDHKPRQLKLRILPADDCDIAQLLAELAEAELISIVDEWVIVRGLTKRQKPDRRYFTTCEHPRCEEPEATTAQRESRRANGGRTTDARRAHDERTEDARRSHATDGDGDRDGDGDQNPRAPRSEMSDRFEEFWDTYGKKVGRKKAEQKYRLALKKPGVTAELLIAAAGQYIAWQRSEGKHPEFTKDPATWLNGEHWTDERATRLRAVGEGPDDWMRRRP